MPASQYFLSATEAATILGVTRATLYAYASRGQLRSEATTAGSRARRYYRDDVERLRERQSARRDPAAVAARGLHWGGPVLESAITLIHDGRLYYRGRDVVELARTATAEDTATLLWTMPGEIGGARASVLDEPCPLTRRQLRTIRTSVGDEIARIQAALPIAAAVDLSAADLRPRAVRRTGARILRLMAAILTGADRHAPLHRALQAAWVPNRPAVGDILRSALVLCADHELNVSAFAGRCAASAGASPYDVVSTALATFKGYKHGGAAPRVLALAVEARTPQRARAAVARHLRSEGAVPGFGHPLYPGGDPRGRLLLQLAESSGNTAAWEPFRLLARAGAHVLDDQPNLDCGLAAITRAYGLPTNAPTLIFALGRTIGWIAHALEEYASGHLIRPRARYIGPPPQT